MRRLSDRRVVTFFALVLASGLCLALLLYRGMHDDASGYRFLAWNLMLAWVPFVLALGLYDSERQGRPRSVLVVLGALWLLFLPNAPYIVTDFIHVGEVPGAPLWYDAGMTAAFAGTGLVLGLGSILLVQGVVTRRLGSVIGWAMIGPVLLLCSLGVGMGRFQRLNSWDALTRPKHLLQLVGARLADPTGRPAVVVALVALTGFLAVAYALLYAVSALGPEREGQR